MNGVNRDINKYKVSEMSCKQKKYINEELGKWTPSCSWKAFIPLPHFIHIVVKLAYSQICIGTQIHVQELQMSKV